MLCQGQVNFVKYLTVSDIFLLNVVFFFFMYGAFYAESIAHTLAVKYELILWLCWVLNLPFCNWQVMLRGNGGHSWCRRLVSLLGYDDGCWKSVLISDKTYMVRYLCYLVKSGFNVRLRQPYAFPSLAWFHSLYLILPSLWLLTWRYGKEVFTIAGISWFWFY